MQTPEPEKKGGRKPSYTSEQLAAAIDAVRGEGREPTPAFVSKALSALFDISGTVRGETLAREIQAHVEAETQLREVTLLGTLPEEVTSRIGAKFSAAQRVAALIVAEELERLSMAQHERDVSASRERAMLVAQNKALDADLENARAQNVELEEALRKAEAETSVFVNRVHALEQEIQKLQAAGDARNEAFAEVERFLAKSGWTPPRVPQP
jgi:chromosome segregation ATPase